MSGFDGYDAWKTASPYDDEPDEMEQCYECSWRNGLTEKQAESCIEIKPNLFTFRCCGCPFVRDKS